MVQQMHRADEGDVPREEGHIVLLLPLPYEGIRTLRAQRALAPVQEWLTVMRRGCYRASWLPAAAIAEGPYHGGTVVEVEVKGDRAYVAVPPEALETLAGVMAPHEYQMVQEDVAALANPEGHGEAVTRLDRAAWEERQQARPKGEPLPVDAWVAVIRERHLQVELVSGAVLPLDSPWPGGNIVAVCDASGEHRSYFGVPRAVRPLALSPALEMTSAPRGECGQ